MGTKYKREHEHLPYKGDDARHDDDGRRGLVVTVTQHSIGVRWGSSPGHVHVYSTKEGIYLVPGTRTWKVYSAPLEII
jgi:hypothetical protein